MALYKNVAGQLLAVFAYDGAADAPETGDAANITAQISKDGGATAASNDVNPTELDAADAPGIYLFSLTQAETNCDLFILFAQSTTADVQLEPVVIYTLPGDNAAVDVNVVEIEGADPTDTIGDATLDEVVEGGYTMREYLQLMAAVLFGKSSGGGTATITFRDTGDAVNRVVATVDANGNRTNVILTV